MKDGKIIGPRATKVGDGSHPLLIEMRDMVSDWGETDTTDWRDLGRK